LVKKEKLEPNIPEWELKSDFDPSGSKVNYKGEITQPSVPYAEDVVNGSDFNFEDLSFLDRIFFSKREI